MSLWLTFTRNARMDHFDFLHEDVERKKDHLIFYGVGICKSYQGRKRFFQSQKNSKGCKMHKRHFSGKNFVHPHIFCGILNFHFEHIFAD